jgi:hypothetical protein
VRWDYGEEGGVLEPAGEAEAPEGSVAEEEPALSE